MKAGKLKDSNPGNSIKKFLLEHSPAILFMLLFFLVGKELYRDYGFPWDEKYQLDIAKANYNYLFNGDRGLLHFVDRYYGPFFEIVFYSFLKDYTRETYYYLRHLAVFAVNLAGLLAFYFLNYRLFRRNTWALLATALLAFSPRIFADAFYNVKDIPLMDSFIVAVLFLLVFRHAFTQGVKAWVMLIVLVFMSLSTAIALATRISALVIPAFAALVFLWLAWQDPRRWKRLMVYYLLYLGLAFAFTICFWPVLLHDPISGIWNAILNMNSRPYKGLNLIMGVKVPAWDLPWYYLPVWIGVTTPLIVVIPFICSQVIIMLEQFTSLRAGFRSLVNGLRDPRAIDWLVMAGWLYVPVAVVLVLKTTFYDGWRHMFFIYPPVVSFAVLALRRLFQWTGSLQSKKQVVTVFCTLVIAAGVLEPVSYIIRNHPFQNVYFNMLAGSRSDLRQRFEMDYWGLSYKQAIDYILATDPSENIRIFAANSPGRTYIRNMLPYDDEARFRIVTSIEEAQYFVTNFRGNPEGYEYPVYYRIVVDGVEIMTVYKLY